MTGIIILWYGAIVDIPIGWQLCDGTNGTPDLQDFFIVSAGSTFPVDGTGGVTNHVHPFIGYLHYHPLLVGTRLPTGTGYAFDTDFQITTGTTDPTNNVPAYHALCFIQKMAA